MIRRNTAGQVIYLPQLTTTDGTPITSSATLTVAKDGTEAASGGTLAHSANGVWKYTPTMAETDAAIVGLILTGASAVPVVLNLITTGADTSAVALGANTVVPTNLSAAQVRTELATELARIDATITSRNAIAPLDATQTQTAAAAAITAAGLETDSAAATRQTAVLAAIDGIEGGGGSSINVLPAVGIVADRSPGVTLQPVVGETISQSVTLYATDGTTPIDLSGKTLAIVFETLQGFDVAIVPDGSIAVSGDSSNVVTFAYPSLVTSAERTLRFALRDAAAPLTMYLQGLCVVTRGPQVD